MSYWGWVQAQASGGATHTFTDGDSHTPHPTQRPAGESNPSSLLKVTRSLAPVVGVKEKCLSIQACYLCRRRPFPPTTQGGVPALLLARVVAI